MGAKRKGRPRKPHVLKVLSGNPGKRDISDELQLPAAFPPAPEYLSAKAKEAWQRFAADLYDCGVLTKLDGVALELLCNSYAGYLDAQENLVKYGPVFFEKKEGGGIPGFAYSPYWAVAQRSWKMVASMLAEFGMTPAARTRVKVDQRQPDELDVFLGEAQ